MKVLRIIMGTLQIVVGIVTIVLVIMYFEGIFRENVGICVIGALVCLLVSSFNCLLGGLNQKKI